MIVGICKLSFFLPECRSLKDKRQILRKMKDKFFARFKMMLAEVDELDMWQRAVMGFALVGNDKRMIESLIQQAVNFLECKDGAELIDRTTEFVHC